MKKLSVIVLALAACMMLSACGEDTTTNTESSKQEITQKSDSDKITSTVDAELNISDIEEISPSKLDYEFVNNGNYGHANSRDAGPGITITGVHTAAEYIRFPDTIDGEPVLYISSDIEYSANVKALIFPDSAATCGKMPKSVEYVKLPANLDVIDEYAFEGCSELTSIVIPTTVSSIGDYAFKNCFELSDITMSIDHYNSSLFDGCRRSYLVIKDVENESKYLVGLDNKDITSLDIPNDVTVIYRSAFEDCTNLTSISIPDSVTYIGTDAFRGCTNLANVSMSDKTEIGPCAFSNCNKLMDENGLFIVNNKINSCNDDITSVKIPDGVVAIGVGAFSYCTNLKSVSIPDSVTSIGAVAFGNLLGYSYSGGGTGCTSLQEITIPDSVTDINKSAFDACPNLTDIYYKGNSYSIADFYEVFE